MLTKKILLVTATVIGLLVGLKFLPPFFRNTMTELTLFVTGNIRGQTDPCGCSGNPLGGTARRLHYFKSQSLETGTKITVDSGNLLFDTTAVSPKNKESLLKKARALIQTANDTGTRALSIGAHDLSAGVSSLQELQKDAKFPFLSANIVSRDQPDKPLFTGFTILTDTSPRIMIVGLTAPGPINSLVTSEVQAISPEYALQSWFPKIDKKTFVLALTNLSLLDIRDLGPKFPQIGLWVSGEFTDAGYHEMFSNQIVIANPFLGQGLSLIRFTPLPEHEGWRQNSGLTENTVHSPQISFSFKSIALDKSWEVAATQKTHSESLTVKGKN